MAPETHEEQIARALLKLGVDNRLKGAPHYHWWEIGENNRNIHKGIDAALVSFHNIFVNGEKLTEQQEEAFSKLKELYYNPDVNAYTHDMLNEDEQSARGYPLYVDYGYEKGIFRLNEPEQTTQQIRDHFHPINWKEFENYTDWELMLEVIPSMKHAKVRFEMYQNQRWLHDERSQRAAETLAYRIENIYEDKQLPKRMPTTEQQYAILEEYDDRLERGVDARRWLQTVLASFSSKKRAKRRAAVQGEG